MPRHRQVKTLQTLSLRSVGTLIAALAPRIIAHVKFSADPQTIISSLRATLEWLNKLLVTHVPYYLYDTMAVEVLKSIKTLIERTKRNYYPNRSMSVFLTEMNVVVSLTEIVLSRHLKEINFSEWPKIMRYVLYKNLFKLTGLEVLNLGSCTGGWRTSDHDAYILNGISTMRNLRSLCLCFDCTDTVIQVLGENCPGIQCLDVTSSRSVTDRSIAALLKCKSLKELQLHRTSVTVVGMAQLLTGLDKLQDIGRCDEFGDVVKCLHQNHFHAGPFSLRKIQTRDLTTDCLRLFVDMFPYVESIRLFHDVNNSDLTVLTSLNGLQELKLLSCAFYGDYLKQLLEVRGINLTSLHLEHVEEVDINVMLDISENCPHLKSLVLYNCDFLDNASMNTMKLKVQPFQNLERLFWMVDCALHHLEFILINAVNIKNIHLGSSTGITHLALVNILTVNPMKHLEELRILYSSDLSMRSVELLLASCSNLRVLSELESWQGISIEELRLFKQHIFSSNFDLDVRPTLSYY